MKIQSNITPTQLPVEKKVTNEPKAQEEKDQVEIGKQTEKPDFVLTPDQKKELKKLAQEMGINLDQEGLVLTEEQKKEITQKALGELDKAAKTGIATIAVTRGGFAGIRGFLCGLIGLGAAAVGGPAGVAAASVVMGAWGLYQGLKEEKGLLADIKSYLCMKPTPEEKVGKAIMRSITDTVATAVGGLVPFGSTILAPLVTGTPAGVKTYMAMSKGYEHLGDAIMNELNSPQGQQAQQEMFTEVENQINQELKKD